MTFGLGPAGTGKSFLAVAKAVEALAENQVKKIILIRPSVEAGEKLGFLPGSLQEKVSPFLTPLFDALGELLSPKDVEFLLKSGVIEIATLAYMRGRTLKNAFVILDEAQNSTVDQLYMCITRLGTGSKMIINGDLSQVDLPRGVKSGLQFATEAFQGVPGVGFSTFTGSDIVRHALVTRLVKAHEVWKANQA
jgi:phosphate starvation-inducible PhoH-like protein